MYRIRRFAGILGVLAASMVALGAPAFATEVPAPGTDSNHPVVSGQGTAHLVIAGGMPGWQIALIAVAAALAAAAVAVLLDRAYAARRHAPTRTA
jgi:hypothetical protein